MISALPVIRALVVDDSAFVRKVVTEILSRNPFIEVVGTARDGREALELAEEKQPDVITCDLNMPDMDGVAFVKSQMRKRPVPIVIISVAERATDQVLSALDAGAVDFLQKPTALATNQLMTMADQLVEKVKLASTVQMRAVVRPEPVPPLVPNRSATATKLDVVVIGISTGGPQGLKLVIPRLPLEMPVPVCIVLHMPFGYTELYAKRLNDVSAVEVAEAQEGDKVAAGRVLLAPAGRHMTLRRTGTDVTVHLDIRPLGHQHRPAVDVLFRSAAETYDARVLGVVMTGMGADGRDGAAWIKAKGGKILTETEESCVVYGMPRAVDEAGLSDRSVAIDSMAEAIMEQL